MFNSSPQWGERATVCGWTHSLCIWDRYCCSPEKMRERGREGTKKGRKEGWKYIVRRKRQEGVTVMPWCDLRSPTECHGRAETLEWLHNYGTADWLQTFSTHVRVSSTMFHKLSLAKPPRSQRTLLTCLSGSCPLSLLEVCIPMFACRYLRWK